MKKTTTLLLLACLFTANAGAASRQLSAGSKNVSHGSAQIAGGSVQGLSAVVAVPFAASAAIGTGSGQIAHDLNKFADQPSAMSLPVSDETIVSGPSPDQAI